MPIRGVDQEEPNGAPSVFHLRPCSAAVLLSVPLCITSCVFCETTAHPIHVPSKYSFPTINSRCLAQTGFLGLSPCAAALEPRGWRHEQNATAKARLQSTRAQRVFRKTPGLALQILAYRIGERSVRVFKRP
jgi:hypothetical protein